MDETPAPPRRVLFLCTGNFYRSRFAEELFNARASAARLAWVAESRGIAVDLGAGNVGPVSPRVLAGLAARGVAPPGPPRSPAQLREEDLAAADLVVALEEREHRALLAERFGGWPGRVEYWDVPDLLDLAPDEALARIDESVDRLIERLSAADRG